MKIVSTIGVIMLVLGFLTSTLGAFPLADVSAIGPEVTEETPFSKAIVETTAGQIGRIYTTLIADLVTFAYNPDLALAQSRVDQMTTFAEVLADHQMDREALAAAIDRANGIAQEAFEGMPDDFREFAGPVF